VSAAPKYLSARELAALGIPSLPTSKSQIARIASAQGWDAETGPRGVRLIDVNALPDDAQDAISTRLTRAIARPAPAPRTGAGRPKGSDYFARRPDIADFVEAQLAHQKLAATTVRDLIEANFGDAPHIRTLRRFIADLEERKGALLLSFRDPDAYKSKFRLSIGTAGGDIAYANQEWQIDSTKADVMTLGGRRQIIGLIDVYSRRVKLIVAPSESSLSVRRLLAQTIRDWGVLPERLKTDRGSGFINLAVKGALDALGIEHVPVLPGSGDLKPFVERLFGTVQRARVELLPGYVGHSVADAQRLRGKAKKDSGRAQIDAQISDEELQSVLDNYVNGVYHVRHHSGIAMSPMARWASSPVLSAAAPPDDVLLIAFSKLIGPATVTKRGLRFKGQNHWSPALVPFMGQTITIRRDEYDLGALFVFDDNGRYICTAINHMRSGMSEMQFAVAKRAEANKLHAIARDDVRAKMRTYSPEKARGALFLQDAASAANVTMLPMAGPVRETPLIASLTGDAAPVHVPPAADIVMLSAPKPVRSGASESDFAALVARAETLIAADDAGQSVDPDHLVWARRFVAGPRYAAHIGVMSLSKSSTPENKG
jgi:putative transposase